MSWRLAESLVVLRDQVDSMAPQRNKASDGTIGNTDHTHRPSRHNPNRAGVVCAIDLTDDPAHGCPIHAVADTVRAHPHPDLAYVISNGRIAGRSTGWQWHRYTGPNPHNKHAHFGVGSGGDGDPGQPYDDRTAWTVSGNGAASTTAGPGPRTLQRGAKGPDVAGLQKILVGAGLLTGPVDGIFGPQTEAAVRQFQAKLGVAADGVVGPATHAAIARLMALLAATAKK